MYKKLTVNDNLVKIMERYFLIFILLQPFLDLTSYAGWSISELVRALTIGIGFIYLLSVYRKYKFAKYATNYFIVLCVFMLIHFLINYFLKEPYSLSSEVVYIVKTVYFISMLLVYTTLFYSLNKSTKWRTKVQKYFFICLNIIAIVMVLASITETGKRSYKSLSKEGHSGWFFSANDLSTLLAVAACVALIYILNQRKLKNSLYLSLSFFIISLSMLIIGTKVGIGALFIMLGIALVWAVIEGILFSKGWKKLITLVSVSLSVLIIVPFTPAAQNLSLYDLVVSVNTDKSKSSKPDENSLANEDNNEEPEEDTQKPDNSTREEEKINVLSGRGHYLDKKINQYQDAPVSQKIFGMGYGGNYTKNPKQVEMDFLDYFFTYGLLGFILLVSPLIGYTFKIIQMLIKRRFKILDLEIILLGVAVSLGLGVAFLAGHVLTSPASSIYLAIVFSYLLILVYSRSTNEDINPS
ncbi:O-antigen ligase family protein [Virgibacillus kekensis]|uniref:O-antigen ligase family protein n=1 Tax=Virgibacillus kekensis TaxID=202261 RepID=A0ABV9DJK0_9BACI